MTKLIGILIIVLVVWGGYGLFQYWDKYDTDKDLKEKEAAANHIVPEQLQGMPEGLQPTYEMAQKNGATRHSQLAEGLWRARYQDPRRAWIELDYVVAISHRRPGRSEKSF